MTTINRQYLINPGTGHTIGKIAVVHSTATAGNPPATNFGIAFHRDWRKTQTFVHYFVDDTNTVVQVAEEGVVAWGAGYANKYAPLQVELCEYSDRTRALKAYHNFVNFVVARCRALGIPLTLDDGNKTAGIKSHNWCSQNYGGSDHTDPYGYLARIGISKAQFAKDLGAAAGSSASSVVESAGAISASAAKLTVDGYWGPQLTKALQRLYGTTVDGIVSSQYNWHNAGLTGGWQFVGKPVGSLLIAAIQRSLGVKADGILGPNTIKAMQRKAGTPVDGKIDKQSQLVMYMQRCVNAGKRPF